LEQVAKTLDEKGAKHVALELAGRALAFATMHTTILSFRNSSVHIEEHFHPAK
jgi:hypothetical protein